MPASSHPAAGRPAPAAGWTATRMPAWLRRKLDDAGELDGPTGYAARVRTGPCPDCGAPTLRGLDGGDDGSGQPATVDPALLTPAGEAWALATGRDTYRLRGMLPSHLNLHHRNAFHVTHCPIGETDSSGTIRVVAAHECGKPVPASFTETGE